MNIFDILIGGVIASALLLALYAMSKNKEDVCSGSCSTCSMSKSCHKNEKK